MSASIDWHYWRILPEIKQWEACALSIGINPESMRGHPQGWMGVPGAGPIFTDASFPNREAETEFKKRQRLLEASVFTSGFFPSVQGLVMGARWKAVIRLDEFASWCAHIGLAMPPELCALPAPVPPLSKPQAAPAIEPMIPSTMPTLSTDDAVPVLRQQERMIMEWLKENGHEAQRLPQQKNGHGTVKALARAALNGVEPFEGVTTFGKAWDRLRAGNEIKEEVTK